MPSCSTAIPDWRSPISCCFVFIFCVVYSYYILISSRSFSVYFFRFSYSVASSFAFTMPSFIFLISYSKACFASSKPLTRRYRSVFLSRSVLNLSISLCLISSTCSFSFASFTNNSCYATGVVSSFSILRVSSANSCFSSVPRFLSSSSFSRLSSTAFQVRLTSC